MTMTTNTYHCRLCQPVSDMLYKDAVVHLKSVHGYTDETLKDVTRSEHAHLDSKDWYQTDYAIYDGDNCIGVQHIRSDRDADDPMRFEY